MGRMLLVSILTVGGLCITCRGDVSNLFREGDDSADLVYQHSLLCMTLSEQHACICLPAAGPGTLHDDQGAGRVQSRRWRDRFAPSLQYFADECKREGRRIAAMPPAPPTSLMLFLTALLSMGIFRASTFPCGGYVGILPQWFHEDTPTLVGHTLVCEAGSLLPSAFAVPLDGITQAVRAHCVRAQHRMVQIGSPCLLPESRRGPPTS